MTRPRKNTSLGFTLVEVMIVVAVVGILAVIGVPSYIRVRQLSQGRAILNDARQIDAAIDQWALENGKMVGDVVNCASLSEYLKDGPLKAKVAALGAGGGEIEVVLSGITTIKIGNIGTTQVQITPAAKAALPAVTEWGKY